MPVLPLTVLAPAPCGAGERSVGAECSLENRACADEAALASFIAATGSRSSCVCCSDFFVTNSACLVLYLPRGGGGTADEVSSTVEMACSVSLPMRQAVAVAAFHCRFTYCSDRVTSLARTGTMPVVCKVDLVWGSTIW
jgi:hypothetical protein